MSKFQKISLLLAMLPNQRGELLDRLATTLEASIEPLIVRSGRYFPISLNEAIAGTEEALGVELRGFLEESALAELSARVSGHIAELQRASPFPLYHNADFTLARICYAICRAIRPATVVETGVAHGVTSTFILQALALNDHGTLHSIDQPPLRPDAARHVGLLIPAQLRNRWQLHLGSSRRLLPGLMRRIGQADMFVHDSLHTNRNISLELKAVCAAGRRPKVILADDVESNPAFERWAAYNPARFAATVRQTSKVSSIFGISVEP